MSTFPDLYHLSSLHDSLVSIFIASANEGYLFCGISTSLRILLIETLITIKSCQPKRRYKTGIKPTEKQIHKLQNKVSYF